MSNQEADITRTAVQSHPLDPLTAHEISRAVAALKRDRAAADSFRFVQVELHEPSKAQLRDDLSVIPRHADAVLIDRATGQSFDARIDLDTDQVVEWSLRPTSSQPPIMLDEFAE